MKCGTFYGIGVGPGDPELITVRGANLLRDCRCVVVPKAREKSDSIALDIARAYLRPDAEVVEQVYPMTADPGQLRGTWNEAAAAVLALLRKPQDVCFLTLGDPLFYSTHIYLLRALKALDPGVRTVTVPGIMAMGAAAALTDFPLGEGKQPVTVVPAADDLTAVRRALAAGGSVVLMKVGRRLQPILDLLDECGVLGRAVFVAKAGQAEQIVETDLRRLRGREPEAGYLSIVLVAAGDGDTQRG